jgi:mycoredoxin
LTVTIRAYTTGWCSDCARSKRLMRRAGLHFEEIDIEKTPGAEEAMRELNGNSGKVPTILIENEADRTILIEPSDRELTEALRSRQLV